ncbi:MAG: hypothetical protein ACRCUS_09155, partial [Anaerovoracaceae bacterium]
WKVIETLDVYISDAVKDELNMAKKERRDKFDSAIKHFTILRSTDEANKLAGEYLKRNIMMMRFMLL